MDKENQSKLIRGFLFACTEKTEKECFDKSVFGADVVYAPIVIRIRKGDLLFLNNLDTDVLYGVFEAISDGEYNIQSDVWNGKYPYQVKVKTIGEKKSSIKAKKNLSKLGIKRNTPIVGKNLIKLIDMFIPNPLLTISETNSKDNKQSSLLLKYKERISERIKQIDIEEEIPLVEATTLWDFPRQSYGLTPKGNNKYHGVTPALIIYNLIWRYTRVGDLVVDPMCGSGTTIDVCKEEKRKVIGFDIHPVRSDIIQNDARKIPLENESVDMVFIDSPYGDNIRYNPHADSIGKISSEKEEFYVELEKVMAEAHRILKEGKVLGWLIGDQWVKKKFTPVGLKIYERLCKYFQPVDIICVTRKGQSSNTGMWVNRARRFNFYLRGFKYLIIVKKMSQKKHKTKKTRKIKWARYD